MKKALIIDDSRTTRALIKKIVREMGFETSEAGNGQEALEVLGKEQGFSLALVDWNMPVMTGIEFIEQARKIPEYNDILLVMVTTETEMVQVTRALTAGANEYVMKPFTKEILSEKLAILGL
jgi:two-component system, chemotaxis family, chemotaxis protein CheY